jgi:crotonobetainyl-CoA:carnitine CoA-transferase CaiB-like acyl-CoA transferase
MEEEIPEGHAPFIGEHTKEILTKYIGLTSEQLEELMKHSVIECSTDV